MTPKKVRWLWLIAFTVATIVAVVEACVPADDRPPPTTLTMTVSPSPAFTSTVTTSDGWTISFDRVFIDMGNEGFSDSCAVYGEADYDRILNLGAGPNQKLGILHGLGTCDLRFRMGPPSLDAVLGAEVADADKTTMLIPEPDPYSPEGGGGSGTALDLTVTATKGSTQKHFHLMYRRRVRYQRCTPDAPPADASFQDLQQTAVFSDAGAAVVFPSAAEVVFDLRIEPEAIFRDDTNPTSAALRFDPFAQADVDGDGQVTLDELRAVPISALNDSGAFEAGSYDVDPDSGLFIRGKPVVISSLGDFVYELLVPTLVRFRDTGWCVSSANQRRPN